MTSVDQINKLLWELILIMMIDTTLVLSEPDELFALLRVFMLS